jgi:alanine racemase
VRYTITELKEILSAELLQSSDDNAVAEYLSVDTRKISFPATTLFIALKTEHRNGHHFIKDAYAKGVRNFLVSEPVAIENANVLLVSDTITGLQTLAQYHRRRFSVPVIGITGSNGKTIVKEWLNHLLQPSFNIVRSPRSYNSQIGVPLSVVGINEENTLGIFEAGISKRNEMNALAKIIDPTIGILTHIGDAHSEGFDSLEEKVKEKVELFTSAKAVVYNSDDTIINEILSESKAEKFDFGKNHNSLIRIISTQVNSKESIIAVRYKQSEYRYTLLFTTAAAIENSLCCFAAAAALGADLHFVCERMSSLPQPEMRLQLQKALHDSVLINDSYSFDLSSLATALDFLEQQKQTYKSTVILSDLPSHRESDHVSVLNMLEERKIDRCIFIGTKWNQLRSTKLHAEYFESADFFIQHFSSSHFNQEIILIKGAREFKFDELVELFLHQVHQTVMRIDLSAMIQNLKTFKNYLRPQTKIMAMVKAFGYGSGGSEPAKLLQYHGVDYLAVAYADEGTALRKEGVTLPIMVLNPDEAAFNSLVEYDLEPELFSFQILSSFQNFLQRQAIQNYPVHIKLDSGMHRLGFEEKDIDALCTVLQNTNSVLVRSVFTHLAASEDPSSDAFTLEQYDRFKRMSERIKSAITYDFITHLSNSAAILRHAELQSDMVRLGIGLYGVKPASVEMNLQTVAFVTTTIAQLRTVKKGDTVGYNRKGIVTRDSKIATLRIGYADGFRRSLGNGKGRVFVRGKYAPVIGNVCMDMIMVDVTDIEGVQENVEVEIMGTNITVEQLAESSETIPYEILTSIAGRVKRVYLME